MHAVSNRKIADGVAFFQGFTELELDYQVEAVLMVYINISKSIISTRRFN